MMRVELGLRVRNRLASWRRLALNSRVSYTLDITSSICLTMDCGVMPCSAL